MKGSESNSLEHFDEHWETIRAHDDLQIFFGGLEDLMKQADNKETSRLFSKENDFVMIPGLRIDIKSLRHRREIVN